MILDCRMRGDIFARPAIFLKSLSFGIDRYSLFHPYTLLLVRQTDGNATLENWLDKSSLGNRSEDKPGGRIRYNVDHPERKKCLDRKTCESPNILSTSQALSLGFGAKQILFNVAASLSRIQQSPPPNHMCCRRESFVAEDTWNVCLAQKNRAAKRATL
jgi:hypothetical protein